MIIKGTFIIKLRDRAITLNIGELCVVAWYRRQTVAHEEIHIMLFKPATPKYLGDAQHEITKDVHGWI
jgi:intein-encoded DNA endonuclease-like protein